MDMIFYKWHCIVLCILAHDLYALTGQRHLSLSIDTDLHIIIFNGLKNFLVVDATTLSNLLVTNLGFSSLILLETVL